MPPSRSSPLLNMTGLEAPVRVLVAGVGNAGCNSVVRMAESWHNGPDVALINTDLKALTSCGLPRALRIGEKTAKGFGAGGDTLTGRLAAEENLGELQELVSGYDLVVLVGGLGGGTATGALPEIAKQVREAHAASISFVTMPFSFEGERRRLTAEEGLRTLTQHADAIVCLQNDRLQEIVGTDVPLESAFRAVDEAVANGLHSIWRLLTGTSVVQLNFGDVRELVDRSGGLCDFGYAEASGAARAAEVIQRLNENPLLAKGRKIAEAQALLVNIIGGQDLSLGELQGIMGQIRSMAWPKARILFGAIVDPAWRDRVSVTVLAAEQFRDERTSSPKAPPAAKPAETDTDASPDADDSQGDLFPTEGPAGRFDKIQATYHGGQDLDLPTFKRRGNKLSFER